MKDDLSARLRLGDPAALEEAMDRYAAYAAKIIAAYLNRTLPAEDMGKRFPMYSSACGITGSIWRAR